MWARVDLFRSHFWDTPTLVIFSWLKKHKNIPDNIRCVCINLGVISILRLKSVRYCATHHLPGNMSQWPLPLPESTGDYWRLGSGSLFYLLHLVFTKQLQTAFLYETIFQWISKIQSVTSMFTQFIICFNSFFHAERERRIPIGLSWRRNRHSECVPRSAWRNLAHEHLVQGKRDCWWPHLFYIWTQHNRNSNWGAGVWSWLGPSQKTKWVSTFPTQLFDFLLCPPQVSPGLISWETSGDLIGWETFTLSFHTTCCLRSWQHSV